MPNAKKYKSLKENPIRYQTYLEEKKKWMTEKRKKHPFKYMVNKLKTKYKTTIDPIDLWKIAKRQRLICPLTGRKLTNENISLDHILSIKKGGKNSIDNFQLVDYHANLAKFTLTKEELIKLCQDIIYHNSK